MRLRLEREPFDYQVERHNEKWRDHVLRTEVTSDLIAWLRPASVIDPACGDGSIVLKAHAKNPIERVFLADISEPNITNLSAVSFHELPAPLSAQLGCQSAEETLAEPGRYDIAVLTEILEHVEDPVALLKLARERAFNLVASSPLMLDNGQMDDNEEHLWQFDDRGYQEMLMEAGWGDVIAYIPIHLPKWKYDFQIWAVQ